MTYTNVHKVLEGDPEMTKRYASLVGEFRRMKELALALNARRSGARLDRFRSARSQSSNSTMTAGWSAVVRSERNIAHRIIEEFMLAANEAVAPIWKSAASRRCIAFTKSPTRRKFWNSRSWRRRSAIRSASRIWRSVASRCAMGRCVPRDANATAGRAPMEVTLPGADVDIRPQHYQRLTEKLAGKPEERILSYLMLRSLKQARYAAELLGHFALAADEYTHFTSPIRRYPDLIVHRVLKWALENPTSAKGPYRRRNSKKLPSKRRKPSAAPMPPSAS